jgi:hypothetical protein
VVFFNEFRCVIQLTGFQPIRFLGRSGVTVPTNEIHKRRLPTTIELAIQNLCNFILEFTFNFDRRRPRPNTSRNGVGMSGFELRDVEYWMDLAHVSGKFDGKRSWSGLGNNFVGTIEDF